MTVFNRRETTLRCLRTVEDQVRDSVLSTVYVVDDASTDGTREAIAATFPAVRLMEGDGELYWNGGMRLAMGSAFQHGYDFYWWLNDDVELDPDALDRLLEVASTRQSQKKPAIVVGSLTDPDDGSLTYGGVVRSDPLRKMAFSLVRPGETPRAAETMNGNCVLIPATVVERVGNLSPEYRQKLGDYDYGLRARKAGFDVVVAPGTYGTCARHDDDGGHPESDVPLIQGLRKVWSVKELPFRAWLVFCRRWGGPLWLSYFLSPYLRQAWRLLLMRIRH